MIGRHGGPKLCESEQGRVRAASGLTIYYTQAIRDGTGFP